MPRPRPPHLHREVTRHGQVAWYVRQRHGARVRLRSEYDTDEFWAEYRAALSGKPTAKRAPLKHRSFAWAVERYRASPEWTALATATRRQRENIFKIVVETAGEEAVTDIDTGAIRAGRDRRAATPHSANNFLKAMRGLFGWLVDRDLVKTNPTDGVSLLVGKNDLVGHHTWTEEELARFEKRWPVGSRERLAFDLLLYTGLRRGDAVRLGRQHVRDGVIHFPRTEKTGADVTLPLLPPLAESIAATECGDLTFLVTERKLPFVKESFGNWFGEVCRKTGVPGSAHGLRKSGATRAAENGATERELMALFGWSDPKMAAHYTRAADKKRLARAAAQLLLPAQGRNEKRPHPDQGEGVTPENLTKRRG